MKLSKSITLVCLSNDFHPKGFNFVGKIERNGIDQSCYERQQEESSSEN